MARELSDADIERLNQLASMRDQGILTDEEFADQKAALLASATSKASTQPAPSASRTERYALWATGGLIGVLLLGTMCSMTTEPVYNSSANETVAAEPTTSEPEDPNQTTPASLTTDAEPSLGNCHMGTCSWHKILGRKALNQSRSGALLEVTLLGGQSDDSTDDPASAKINWNSAPHSVWVFCSPILPAVMIQTDDGLQTDILPFKTADGHGIPDVLYSSVTVYMDACYSDVPHDSLNPPDLDRYRPLPDGAEEISVSRPTDIISRVTSLK